MIAHAATLTLVSLLGQRMQQNYTPRPDVSGSMPATNANTTQLGAPAQAQPVDAGPPKPQLTSDEIVKTLQAHRPAIQKCYEVEVKKKPAIAGRVNVTFIIQTNGALASAAIKDSTLQDAVVQKCILTELATVTFAPTPQNPIALGYGWSFATSNVPPPK